MRFLVERGADLEVVNQLGYTPLSFATGLEYTALAKLLVDKGANINSTACGVPALCHAANTNNAELADYFLAKGADPDLADRDGNTPLMWACFQGAGAVVTSLLAHGADLNVMGSGFGSAGRTALDAAIERGHGESSRCSRPPEPRRPCRCRIRRRTRGASGSSWRPTPATSTR